MHAAATAVAHVSLTWHANSTNAAQQAVFQQQQPTEYDIVPPAVFRTPGTRNILVKETRSTKYEAKHHPKSAIQYMDTRVLL